MAARRATARIVADLIAGREPPIDATPFTPTRVLGPSSL